MRTLRFLLRKEFRQIFRNKSILAIIIVMPVIQFLILPLAADYEVKSINLTVVDNDHSGFSRQLISSITASGYFKLTGYTASYKRAFNLIEQDKADLILEIPAGFEKNLVREGKNKLSLAVNAINGTKASLGGAYLSQIINAYNDDVRLQLAPVSKSQPMPSIEIRSSNWFNPLLNYQMFIVPGILAILITMIGGFLSALNIVKEKEAGTIEQINVTPIRKHLFILGKLLPFWGLSMAVFTVGILLGYLVYGIVPQGSLTALYFFVAVYLLVVLGFGLLVSTFCETQQQAMLVMFFFMMIFILMSGLFTPIESMPYWAGLMTKFNPVRYLIEVMRMVILKGSSLQNVSHQLGIVLLMAVVLNGWAVMNYKKTV